MCKSVLFLIFCYCFKTSFGLFDYQSTKILTNNKNDSCFGYSILLQKGNPSLAIVGAPRAQQGGNNTGAVYKCDLSTNHCMEYPKLSKIQGVYPGGRNGDMIGMDLAGDSFAGEKFITCAPRFTTMYSTQDYFINGRCFRVENYTSELIMPLQDESQIGTSSGIVHYNAAFAQAGFSVDYSREKNLFVFGVPGKAMGTGALAVAFDLEKSKLLSEPLTTMQQNQDRYLGYAVSSGKFASNSPEIYYVAGAPRADGLKGSVLLMDWKGNIKHRVFGEEMGSYFGSELLVIGNKKGDELLVSAPTYSGDSWDEGCVYYYKNLGNEKAVAFSEPVRLANRKTASRFGTVLADAGDVDLDSYTDCAISAPYEDQGAVYIFFGSERGFSNDRFHRIEPSHFSPRFPVRGFGLGISKGVDIDNNKHSDIAIGAYQSGHVFVLFAEQMFDVTMNLSSSSKIIYTSTNNFTVKYCLSFQFRNRDTSKKLSFVASIVLNDDRILNRQNFTNAIAAKPNEQKCFSATVFLKTYHLNIEPLVIPFGWSLKHQGQVDSLKIPVSYDCGSDNVCQTSLGISSAKPDINAILLGVNNELRVNIKLKNSGESAYQPKLYITLPSEISLINLRECDQENEIYVCVVAPVLNGELEKSFLFDITNIKAQRKSLRIGFKVESIGEDVDRSDNAVELNVPVILQNAPFVDGRSIPSSLLLNKSESEAKITHEYLLGNYGPSPLNFKLVVLLPQIADNITTKVDAFSGADLLTECKDTKFNLEKAGCAENCSVVLCRTGYLQKSNKNAVISVNFVVNAKKIGQLSNLQSSLFLSSETHTVIANTSTEILTIAEGGGPIPFWAYIVSILAGLVLFSLLIFSLYKCNFFKRTYKELRMEMQKDSQSVILKEETEDDLL